MPPPRRTAGSYPSFQPQGASPQIYYDTMMPLYHRRCRMIAKSGTSGQATPPGRGGWKIRFQNPWQNPIHLLFHHPRSCILAGPSPQFRHLMTAACGASDPRPPIMKGCRSAPDKQEMATMPALTAHPLSPPKTPLSNCTIVIAWCRCRAGVPRGREGASGLARMLHHPRPPSSLREIRSK